MALKRDEIRAEGWPIISLISKKDILNSGNKMATKVSPLRLLKSILFS